MVWWRTCTRFSPPSPRFSEHESMWRDDREWNIIDTWRRRNAEHVATRRRLMSKHIGRRRRGLRLEASESAGSADTRPSRAVPRRSSRPLDSHLSGLARARESAGEFGQIAGLAARKGSRRRCGEGPGWTRRSGARLDRGKHPYNTRCACEASRGGRSRRSVSSWASDCGGCDGITDCQRGQQMGKRDQHRAAAQSAGMLSCDPPGESRIEAGSLTEFRGSNTWEGGS